VRKQSLKQPKTSEDQGSGKVDTAEHEGVLTGLGSSRDVRMWTERQRLDVTGVGISQQFVLQISGVSRVCCQTFLAPRMKYQ
jgi:hypothetical protein